MRIPSLLCLAVAALTLSGCAAPQPGRVAEVAPFRLVDRSGHVSVHARLDEDRIERAQGASTEASELVFQEEVAVDTESYVYHPNFLVMNVSGGLLFDQRRNKRDDLEASDQSATWNLGARLNFLRRKPYPFTLFFGRENPLVSAGLAGSFTRELTTYGVNATVLRPFLPVRLELDAHRNVAEGEGFGQVIDETVDFLGLTASREFRPGTRARLTYELTRTASRSGSTSLPIRATDRTDQRLDVDSRIEFGEQRQFQLANFGSYRLFEDPDRTDFRYTSNLYWKNSDRLSSFYNVSLGQSTRPTGDTVSRGARAGMTLRASQDLVFTGDVHGDLTEEEGRFETSIYGVTGGVTYRRSVALGELRLSHSLGYDKNEQTASAASGSVIDERVTLSGTTPAELDRERVIASSVQVSNEARTQIFVEGIDYDLVVVGERTSLRRIPTGAIASGDPVLVDYLFELQGTFSYDQFSHSHLLGLTIAKHYDLFVRYQGQHLTVRSGTPTNRLNPIDRFEVGARADVPITAAIAVGGEVRYVRQDEAIAPFTRLGVDGYVRFELPLGSELRLSARRVVTEHESAGADMDLIGFGADLRSRPFYGLNLSAILDHEEDSGESPRTSTRGKLRAAWRIRRLSLYGEAGYLRERVRGFQRDDLTVRFTARRDFR